VGPIILIGGTAVTVAEGVVATTALVVVMLALLTVVGFANPRLPWPDDRPDVRPDEPGSQ
jgi:hypothetical protein